MTEPMGFYIVIAFAVIGCIWAITLALK